MTNNYNALNEEQEPTVLAYPFGGYVASLAPAHPAPPGPLLARTANAAQPVQWSESEGAYYVCDRTTTALPPGVYSPTNTRFGFGFKALPYSTEDILRLPHTEHEKVLSDVTRFWEMGERLARLKIRNRRGILMYGPPGSGKTSNIRLLTQDIVERGGVGIELSCHPSVYRDAVTNLRKVQPDTPLLVIMEDLDAILQMHGESDVLNILDGVFDLENVVYVATTNYPEKMGERIWNRPSRFDKRYYIGDPTLESRLLYLRHLCGDMVPEADLTRWAIETDGLNLSHLKELITGVVAYGNEYQSVLKDLKDMTKPPKGDLGAAKLGFGR